MKRYLILLTGLLILCAGLFACVNADVPTETSVESVTDAFLADTGEATVEETEAPTEAPTEPATEAPTETPTEPATEPATEPEALVSAPAPEEVLASLSAEVTPVQISFVSKQVTLNGVDQLAVLNAFTEKGYVLAGATPAFGTRLATNVLKSLEYTVTVMQTSEGPLHVLWESSNDVSISPLFADKETASGEVVMAQIGIDRGKKEDNPMIGMCYVYRLADGTALIIDGGINHKTCAENLFNTLEKMNVAKDENGKYRITAWIFSHGHSDHMGIFKKFAPQYAEMTDVTYVMFNFPTEDVAPKGGTTDEAFMNLFREAYPNVKRVVPHAGLTYFFGNLSVHMLFAPELLYTTEEVDYYNSTSLLFRVEANGQSILHMGDASEAASKAAWNENSSDAFKSTALQITHHGLYTGPESHEWRNMKKIYQATDAGIGLLPMGTRLTGNARNGRHTVLVGWGMANYQISFVINKKDSRNGASTDQAYFDKFVADVAAGTADRETLFGYNGINTVDNGKGMLTYISASEDAPMATVFSLSSEGMTLTANEELAVWLGK